MSSTEQDALTGSEASSDAANVGVISSTVTTPGATPAATPTVAARVFPSGLRPLPHRTRINTRLPIRERARDEACGEQQATPPTSAPTDAVDSHTYTNNFTPINPGRYRHPEEAEGLHGREGHRAGMITQRVTRSIRSEIQLPPLPWTAIDPGEHGHPQGEEGLHEREGYRAGTTRQRVIRSIRSEIQIPPLPLDIAGTITQSVTRSIQSEIQLPPLQLDLAVVHAYWNGNTPVSSDDNIKSPVRRRKRRTRRKTPYQGSRSQVQLPSRRANVGSRYEYDSDESISDREYRIITDGTDGTDDANDEDLNIPEYLDPVSPRPSPASSS